MSAGIWERGVSFIRVGAMGIRIQKMPTVFFRILEREEKLTPRDHKSARNCKALLTPQALNTQRNGKSKEESHILLLPFRPGSSPLTKQQLKRAKELSLEPGEVLTQQDSSRLNELYQERGGSFYLRPRCVPKGRK